MAMRWQKIDDDYLQSLTFVAFDTETTGLWAPANKIVELGAVKFTLSDAAVKRFQALVNPGRKIPSAVVQVHGITDTMVRDAETIEPVLNQFIEFVGPDSVLIAHNALFDIAFVGCEMNRVGMPLNDNPILDTVDIFQKYRPGLESYSLLSLARELGVGRDQNHRAADDAALVWKLFMEVSEQFPYMQSDSDFRREFTIYRMSQWQGKVPPLPEAYSDISRAIDEERRLQIDYAANGRPVESRIIRPLRIHVLRNAFYIAAFCERSQEERTFRLDRIRRFKLLSV